MGELTHFNKQGRARMVDVTKKAVTHRRAVAAGEIHVSPETMAHIKNGTMKKGGHPGRQAQLGADPHVPPSALDGHRHHIPPVR